MLPTREVIGTYTDSAGNPAVGYIEFTPSRDVIYENDLITADKTLRAFLDETGSFSIDLAITNHIDTSHPFIWLVDEKIENGIAWCLCVSYYYYGPLRLEDRRYDAQATECAPCAQDYSGGYGST